MANSTTLYKLTDGRVAVDVTENKVLTLADNGIVQNVITDAITVTLPATTAGAAFTVRNGGVAVSSGPKGTGNNGTALVTVAPNSVDKIAGNGFTATDNKAALNTKSTSRVGDQIKLIGDGTDGWNVLEVKGTWARAS